MSRTAQPGLFASFVESERARTIFSDESRLQRMLDFEAALARAEGRVGVIPAEAAAAIAGHCRAERFDLAALARDAARAGNPAIPVVRELTALVVAAAPQAGRFVHWGATSQDVLDTALVLGLRDALEHLDGELRRLGDAVADLAERHRETVAPARTLLQHALPTTLGFELAASLDALGRHRIRMTEMRARVSVLQLGGAVGTLAALGARGPAVAQALAADLGLSVPDFAWHAHRDRLAEVATSLGVLVGTLGKMARDLALRMQTEVGELAEPSSPGGGGSSTMPQKRNPVAAAAVLAAATRTPGLVATMLAAMVQEHERGVGGWHAEWDVLPEIVVLACGALERLADAFTGLEVDEARMRENLGRTQTILAEAVSMKLAEAIGRQAAHEVVERAAARVRTERIAFREALLGDPCVTEHLAETDVDRLLEPSSYLGVAQNATRAAVAAWRGGAGEGDEDT